MQWNDEIIRLRNRLLSYLFEENRRLRRRDFVDSLFSITLIVFNFFLLSSRSRSLERIVNRKFGERDRKIIFLFFKNFKKCDKMFGNFRNLSRNEVIVKRQFERYEEENKEKMLVSVDDFLGKFVGSVIEYSYFEFLDELFIF